MNFDNGNDQKVWVIKNNNNDFVLKNSIRQSGKDTWQYISFKTFSPECRGSINKGKIEENLSELIQKNILAEFDTAFHLEHIDINIIIKQHKEFVKFHSENENLVLYEKVINPTLLSNVEAI